MVFILPVLFLLIVLGLRLQKNKTSEPIKIDKSYTLTIRGIFIVLIVLCSYFTAWINSGGSLNRFDVPMERFLLDFGQLIYVPFFFYSGFGIFETYRTQGKEYARKIPLQQMLRHFLSYFIAWILFSVTALALKSPYSLKDYLLSAFALTTIGNSSWFVIVMIFLYFFSFVSFRIADQKTAVAINILFAIMLVFALKGFGFPSYYWNTLFAYVFGVWYSYLKDRIDSKILKNLPLKLLFLGIGVGGLALSFFLNQNIPFNDFKNAAYVFPVFFFCVILVSFTSIFTIKSKLFHFLGTNAFWIYVLHQLPLIWLKNVSFIYNNKYLYFAAALIITIPLAFVLNKVFNYFWNMFAKNHGSTSEENNVRLGIVISYITLFVSIIGAFVVTPRVLENLGDEQYGLLSFANSITAWLTVISSALAASYIKFASEHKKENKDIGIVNTSYFRIFGILSLIMLVIIGAGIAVFRGFNIQLSQYTFEQNKLILWLILISGINVALNVLFSVFTNYLTYNKQFIFIRIVALAVAFLTFACNLIFSFVTKNVLSISIVAVVLTTLSSAITILFAFKNQRMTFARARFKETSPLIRSIITFSSFILLNAVVDQINVNLDKTLLGIMVNAQAVTDYTLAKYFNAYLLTLSVAISSTFVPKIHELVTNNKKEELSALYLKVSKSQMMIMFLVGGGFIAVGKEFMNIWLGIEKEYIYYYAIVPIMLDMICLSCNTCIEIQRAMNKHKFRAFLYIGLALINIAISITLIKLLPDGYQIWGAFIGTAFSVVVGNWIILNVYNKVKIGLPMGKYFLNVAKHIVYAGVGVAVALLLRFKLPTTVGVTARFLIQGIVFSVIYFALLLVFERKTIIPLIKKVFGKIKTMAKGAKEN